MLFLRVNGFCHVLHQVQFPASPCLLLGVICHSSDLNRNSFQKVCPNSYALFYSRLSYSLVRNVITLIIIPTFTDFCLHLHIYVFALQGMLCKCSEVNTSATITSRLPHVPVTLFQPCVLDGEFRSCHHLSIPINFQWLHSSLTIKSKLLAMFQDLV